MIAVCNGIKQQLMELIPSLIIVTGFKLGAVIAVGYLSIQLALQLAARFAVYRGSAHVRMLIQKMIWYIGGMFIGMNVLTILGFDLSALLGAAGIAGIAVGFAAQTGVANLISGLFLLSESFVVVGDEIVCKGTAGIIESIDLFSVKIRTSDGMCVRIPNEQFIKETVVDVTYYGARRVAIVVGVSGAALLDDSFACIRATINRSKGVLEDRQPSVIIDSVSSYTKQITVHVWVTPAGHGDIHSALINDIHTALVAQGVVVQYVMRG